ncbi:hypothetical protein XELAEV_18013509mg [Xenopus laevis]|uniref:Uncharacterized protein n=1 Tax=Xenopus laevis TaxID=8355 RepID=A0A974DPI2_XENLA|nr:hypothetical protein XELAEV_18013509mg [Xenopus laevis]
MSCFMQYLFIETYIVWGYSFPLTQDSAVFTRHDPIGPYFVAKPKEALLWASFYLLDVLPHREAASYCSAMIVLRATANTGSIYIVNNAPPQDNLSHREVP